MFGWIKGWIKENPKKAMAILGVIITALSEVIGVGIASALLEILGIIGEDLPDVIEEAAPAAEGALLFLRSVFTV
jgi:zinc transporter ZupT